MCLVLETANPVAKSYKQQPVAELQEQINFNSVLQQEKIETLVEKMERWSLDNSADSNLVAKLVKSEGKVSTIQENMAAELQASPTQVGFVLHLLCLMFCARRRFMAFHLISGKKKSVYRYIHEVATLSALSLVFFSSI